MNDVRIWHASLERPSAEVASLYGLLSDDERARAARFTHDRDKRRFIVARGTLRILLGEETALPPERVELVVLPGGKPCLADAALRREVHFNVSHCDDVAVFALADQEIGIDIERISAFDGMARVTAHFFSRDERTAFDQLEEAQRARFFFRTWVRKEAYVKATGRGFAIEPSRLRISEPPGGSITIENDDGAVDIDNRYAVHDLDGIEDHVTAVAAVTSGYRAGGLGSAVGGRMLFSRM